MNEKIHIDEKYSKQSLNFIKKYLVENEIQQRNKEVQHKRKYLEAFSDWIKSV